MSTYTPITLEERSRMLDKYLELKNSGQMSEAEEWMKTIPLPPYLAKALMEVFGADMLANSGYNLSEAEAEYGKDWLV